METGPNMGSQQSPASRVEQWRFRPHPLLRGGHLQTVVGIYLRFQARPYGARLHYLPATARSPLEEGDQLVLHEDRPAGWSEGDPVVLLIHGLGGSFRSTYMTRVADRLVQRGCTAFRMDMRGCGQGAAVAKGPTHCGRSEDVRTALAHLARLYPRSPTLAVGFSLGGMLILNMLAEAGDSPIGNYHRGLAICPPIDLFDVERRFATRGGRPYERFFIRVLWRQIARRWRRFPELVVPEITQRPRRLRVLDEHVIAPAAGYASADAYYAATQAGPKLAAIRQPVSIVAAEDDPVVPSGPLLQYPRSADVETVLMPSGGHLGFVGRGSGDPDSRWLDWRIVEWVEASANLGNRRANERSRGSVAVQDALERSRSVGHREACR